MSFGIKFNGLVKDNSGVVWFKLSIVTGDWHFEDGPRELSGLYDSASGRADNLYLYLFIVRRVMRD